MTEERKCYNCAIGLICEECNEDQDHSKWQPIAQEKPMENKVIFESEEHYIDYYSSLYGPKPSPWQIEENKKYGYIRKTALEEAKEYEKHFARIMDLGLSCTIKDLEYSMRIIERLKSEIERLKK
jgi:hypothetical protein